MPVIYNEFGSTTTDKNSNTVQGIASAMIDLEANGVGSASFLYYDPNGKNSLVGSDFTQVDNGGYLKSNMPAAQDYTLTTWGKIAAKVIAANPYPGGTGGGETLSVNSNASVPQNTAFTVSGSITGLNSAPILQYQNNNSGWSALPTGTTLTSTSFQFTDPGMAANSAATVSVRDANNTSITATGPPFVVTGGGLPHSR
jgi:hypothetical protein